MNKSHTLLTFLALNAPRVIYLNSPRQLPCQASISNVHNVPAGSKRNPYDWVTNIIYWFLLIVWIERVMLLHQRNPSQRLFRIRSFCHLPIWKQILNYKFSSASVEPSVNTYKCPLSKFPLTLTQCSLPFSQHVFSRMECMHNVTQVNSYLLICSLPDLPFSLPALRFSPVCT